MWNKSITKTTKLGSISTFNSSVQDQNQNHLSYTISSFYNDTKVDLRVSFENLRYDETS